MITGTRQYLQEDLLILLYNLFSNSHVQRNINSLLYIAYRILWFLLRHVLVDVSYDSFLQIISAIAKEFLISYKYVKGTPETQSLQYCNNECYSKPNQKIYKTEFSS